VDAAAMEEGDAMAGRGGRRAGQGVTRARRPGRNHSGAVAGRQNGESGLGDARVAEGRKKFGRVGRWFSSVGFLLVGLIDVVRTGRKGVQE
jgi:hypothetical protein